MILCYQGRSFNRMLNREKGLCEERSDEAISQKNQNAKLHNLYLCG